MVLGQPSVAITFFGPELNQLNLSYCLIFIKLLPCLWVVFVTLETLMEEKRRFTRIFFSTPAKLQVSGQLYDTSLIDISLKGALIKNTEEIQDHTRENCNLTFILPDSDIQIEMSGKIVHTEVNTIGVACDKIDIDSVTHLRRLIELNIGSEEMLHRDLASLSHPDSD